MDYEQAKDLAGSTDAAVRRSVASQADGAPELLYFLARDADASVRLAVAANPSAPREADLLLARDDDDDVRTQVGEKLGRTPQVELSTKKQALTVEVTETLAADGNAQVRAAIAVALQQSIDAPAHVVQRLARDIEIRVASPILLHSPILADRDLIDIMSSGPIKGVLNAIAKRRNVSPGVSEILVNRAIASPDHASAVGDLLSNDTARIAGGTMEKIIEKAPEYDGWHGPLAARKDLTSDHLRRVASIPSDTIAETMSGRSDLDEAALTALSHMVGKRMAELTRKREAEADAAPLKPAAADRFLEAIMKGGKIGPVSAAISLRAGLPIEVATRMLTSQNAKAVVALAWKAGLSANQAHVLQTSVGGISQNSALAPSVIGGYRIDQPEMEWQIGLYVGS